MLFKFYKFFTLQVVDRAGRTRKASFKEKIKWVKDGAKLRDAKIIDRYCQIKKLQEYRSAIIKYYKI